MSKPWNAVPRNLSEDDSSDGDSEASFGPPVAETDRFGFILVNGSTAGREGPPPEVVRQREAKWINIISQWDDVMHRKSSKVKEQCQKGIPASLRSKCWPLLCGALNRMKDNKNLYQNLDEQAALQSWVDIIERDLDRQFPFHEMFVSREGHGQRGLFRVLKAYTQYQPEEGYCQAQGPVAAVLLMNMPAEEAFWCLVQISQHYLPGYYSPLLEGVLFDAALLTGILKRTCPAAHKHLQQHGVEPLMYATDWLMCLYTRHLPFNTLLRVWDLFFCYGVQILLQVAVVLVRRVLGRAEQRQECQGQMEILERLRGVKEQVQQEDDTFIAEVYAVPLSKKALQRQTEKELENWRKVRPSSTFDPRGRCHGYRMALACTRAWEAVKDRKEREAGNLSAPLFRSVSTLSLSPGLLRKKWGKSGKSSAGKSEGGGGIGRHFSMGPWEGARDRWVESNPKRAQRLTEERDESSEEDKEHHQTHLTEPMKRTEPQPSRKQTEDKVSEECDKHNEPQLTEPNKEKEPQPSCEQTEDKVSEECNKHNEPQLTEPNKEKEPQPSCEQTEDKVSEECDKHNEPHLREPNKEHESHTEPKEQTEDCAVPRQHLEESPTDEELQQQQRQSADCRMSEEENHQARGKEEIKHLARVSPQCLEAREEGDGASQTDTTEDPAKKPSSGDVAQDNTSTAQDQAGEEQDRLLVSQSHIPEEHSSNMKMMCHEQKIENRDGAETWEGKGKHVTEKYTIIGKENHTESENDTGANTTRTQTILDFIEDPATQSGFRAKNSDTEYAKHIKTEEHIEMSGAEIENQPEIGIVQRSEIEKQREVGPVKYCHLVTNDHQQQDTCVEIVTASLTETTEIKDANREACTEAKLKSEDGDTNAEDGTKTKVERGGYEGAQEEETQVDLNTEKTVDPQGEILSLREINMLDEYAEEKDLPDLVVPMTQCTKADPEPGEAGVEKAQKDTHMDKGNCSKWPAEGAAVELAKDSVTFVKTTVPVTPLDNHHTSAQLANCSATAEPNGRSSLLPRLTQSAEGLFNAPTVENKEMADEAGEPMRGAEDVMTTNSPESTYKDEGNATESNIQAITTDEAPVPLYCEEPQDSERSHEAAKPRASASSGDFRVRKTSSSRGSRPARRLSEDIFTAPQQTAHSQTAVLQQEHTRMPIHEGVGPALSEQTTGATAGGAAQYDQRPPDTSKYFGLFRRRRGEQPKQAKTKGEAKLQVPKILIQDFSDGVGKGDTVYRDSDQEETLSSKERRKRRRERERREKEEEKQRKKREKEVEREMEWERRKQTKKKTSQAQRDNVSSNTGSPGNNDSHKFSCKRDPTPHADTYF